MTDSRTRTVVLVVVIAVVVVVAVNLVARGLDDAVGGREPSGADSSSYATQSAGLAAFTELLTRYGHDIRRIRGDLADATLSPDETVILADPGTALTADDSDALRSFAESGGRLVMIGVDPSAASQIIDNTPGLQPGRQHYRQFAPALDELTEVLSAGSRAYENEGDAEILVRDRDRVLALAQPLGAGDVVHIPAGIPHSFLYLDQADNAALGLLLTGDTRQTVVFVEGVHGYDRASGLSAIPSRWKVALLVLVAAAIVFAWARGRRLGPADEPNRTLPPARAEYVDALSGQLARTGEPGAALDGLGAWARRTAAMRAGLPPDASPHAVEDALRNLGLTDEEVDALRRAPRTEAEILALGRAATRVTQGRLTP